MIAKRKTERNTREIWVWMIRSGMRPARIAEAMGVSLALVSDTISGRKNNRRVLRYLMDAGCPKEHLDLPEDLRDAI